MAAEEEIIDSSLIQGVLRDIGEASAEVRCIEKHSLLQASLASLAHFFYS